MAALYSKHDVIERSIPSSVAGRPPAVWAVCHVYSAVCARLGLWAI